ncbi:MAG: patatin-like phospholipase family protein [Steroidobacteraceae bacterium]
MLNVEPAARPRRGRDRIGLALAGGGPLGAFYQLGALHALADCTSGLDLTRLYGYVGVSSGAVIAAALANELTTQDMVRLFFVDDAAERFPLTPGILMRPAVDEYVHRALKLPSLVAQALSRWAQDPLRQSWAEMFTPLADAIPTGVFENRSFERYLRQLFSTAGRTNDFRQLRCMLRIVATDLNLGTEVRFGEKGLDAIPISEAIRASTALPGLYTPVRIGDHTYVDGALLRTMHASLVLEHGCDLVICVNPLVTFDGSRRASGEAHHDLADAGLAAVMGQTFRALIQSRMQVGMARYRNRYPHSDRLLLQPDRTDEAMFFVNIFRFKERCRLAEHAYQCTRRDLRAQAGRLAPLLQRHGVTLRHERLADIRRHFVSSIGAATKTKVMGKLNHTLDHLSAWLDQQTERA